MPVAVDQQTSIYETTLENPELKKLLDTREQLKTAKGEALAAFKHADEAAKEKIRALDLGDAPVRVGGFVIREIAVEAREVNFSTSPTSRLQIRLLDE